MGKDHRRPDKDACVVIAGLNVAQGNDWCQRDTIRRAIRA